MEEEKKYKGRGKKFGDFPIREKNKKSPYKAIPLLLGITMGLGSLFSIGMGIAGLKRAKEARERAKELDRQLQKQQDDMARFDFRVQNPYEDIDVTTKAQQVAQDAQTQQAADILATLAPTATMGSTAALATSIAKQGSSQAAKLAGQMSQAEFKLQQQSAKAQLAIDQSVKQQEFNRDAAIMNMQMYRAAGEYGAATELGKQGMSALSAGVQGLGTAASSISGAIDTTQTEDTGDASSLNLQNNDGGFFDTDVDFGDYSLGQL